MRDELERIERAAQYLSGKLASEEAAAFEQQMKSDAELKAAVDAQYAILQGLERAALRREVQNAGSRYRRAKQLRRWSLAAGAAVVLIAAVYLLTPKLRHTLAHTSTDSAAITGYTGTLLPALNEQGGKQWSLADSALPAQVFQLDAA